jgi:hypothetical protein
VDDADETLPTLNSDIEADVKELMGLFDLPAFARRGQELEYALKRINDRCAAARGQMLEMVHLRLRQWSRAVTGPAGWEGVFSASIDPLWPLSAAEPPEWASANASPRVRRAIAVDLVSAVLRFNRRWLQFIDRANLEPTNFLIEQYNRYYVLEKECVMGSARLAARHFTPVPRITADSLHAQHPTLPVPRLVDRSSRQPG